MNKYTEKIAPVVFAKTRRGRELIALRKNPVKLASRHADKNYVSEKKKNLHGDEMIFLLLCGRFRKLAEVLERSVWLETISDAV